LVVTDEVQTIEDSVHCTCAPTGVFHIKFKTLNKMVAARSKAWVCGHSLGAITVSNPAARSADICFY
jgi:hypothetical protein